MAQLLKLTNSSNTNNTIQGATVVPGGSYYVQLGQARVVTDASGMITNFALTNGNTVIATTDWVVETGLLVDNGRFCVHLTSRHGRT